VPLGQFWKASVPSSLKNTLKAGASLVLGAVLSHPAAAAAPQDSPAAIPGPAGTTAPRGTLEEVTVTANRRSQNIQKVAGAVTAISSKVLARRHVDSLEDIVNAAPNAEGYVNDGRERPRYFIRGIGNGNVADNAIGAVAIYNDEVYLNNISMQGFPLFDTARVEILNGPQGTLWGKNATAGAIQFVSNAPNFIPSGYAQVDLGDYGQRRGEAVLNGPLLGDKISGRLSVRYENSDSWSTDTVTGKHSGDFGDLALRGQVLGHLNDDIDVLLSANYRDLLSTRVPFYFAAAPSANSPLITSDTLSTHNNVDDRETLQSGGALAHVTWRLDWATLTSITAFDQAARKELFDFDNTPVEYSREFGYSRPTQESQEFRLASSDRQRLSWITGLYYFHEYLADTLATGTLPPGAPTKPAVLGTPAFARTDFGQNTHSVAAFANATYTILPNFKITGGARFTYDTMDIRLNGLQGTGSSVVYNDVADWYNPASVSSPIKTIASYGHSQSWSKFNYEIEPQYQITPDDLLYARIATGYRSGNFNSQVTPNPVARGSTPLQGPDVVNPETTMLYEVGYKSSLLNDRLTFATDVFYMDYKNIQVSYTATDPVTRATIVALANAASGRSYGEEFSFRAEPLPDLTIDGNVGLNLTGFTNFTGPSYTPKLTGNQFARAPHQSANLSADYQFETGYGQASVGTHWNYTGHYFYLISNEVAEALQQNGEFLGDVHASFRPAGTQLEFGGSVSNVTGVRYKIQVLPYSGTTHTYSYAYGAPEMFLLSARIHF
jgi:iron complex outermembrane receptor protein